MDLQMPVMGGLEATIGDSRARARDRRSHPHRRDDGARHDQRSRALPRRRHGRVSFEADRPARCCSRWSNSRPTRQPLVRRSRRNRRSIRGRSTADALRDRLSGDDELITDVIRLFLEDCPVRLAAIKDAVTRKHAEDLRTSAHALKGSAANLSATGLFEAARVLERMGAESRMAGAEGAWRQLSMEASHVISVLRPINHGTDAVSRAS